MPIAVERAPRPRWPAMPQIPQNCEAAQIVEPIMIINEHCPAWLYFLIQELYGFQYPKSPITPFLSLALYLDLPPWVSPPPPHLLPLSPPPAVPIMPYRPSPLPYYVSSPP